MLASLFQRLLHACLVVLAMTVIVFVGTHVIGNPVDLLISPDATEAERLRVIAEFGLDQPLWRQYLTFLGGVAQGEFGVSYVFNEPAFRVILQRMPATLELAVAASLIAILVGVPLGLIAGLRPDALVSRFIMGASIIGFSIPTFWLGLMAIMFFSVHLGILPSSGRGPTLEFLGLNWSILTIEGWRHLILPASTLALFNLSLILRLTRAGVVEAMPQDYVLYARARGLSRARIVGIHVLRNILIPVVTVAGLEFGSLVAFSLVTETIFAWPGMGKLIIDSINSLDRPVMVAYLVIVAVLFVTINLVVDIVYRLLDPRVGAARRTA